MCVTYDARSWLSTSSSQMEGATPSGAGRRSFASRPLNMLSRDWKSFAQLCTTRWVLLAPRCSTTTARPSAPIASSNSSCWAAKARTFSTISSSQALPRAVITYGFTSRPGYRQGISGVTGRGRYAPASPVSATAWAPARDGSGVATDLSGRVALLRLESTDQVRAGLTDVPEGGGVYRLGLVFQPLRESVQGGLLGQVAGGEVDEHVLTHR